MTIRGYLYRAYLASALNCSNDTKKLSFDDKKNEGWLQIHCGLVTHTY